MRELNNVKSYLRKKSLWKSYKKTFKNKQTRLMISFVALSLNSKVNAGKLGELERIIWDDKTKKGYIKACLKLKVILPKYASVDWKSLGAYLWYVCQTSTFYKDIKHGKTNIYTNKNYIYENEKKRNFFYKWARSLEKNNPAFNIVVKTLLRKVL